MVVELYHMDGSAPCRAVRLVAKHIGVPLELHEVDLATGQHLKPEFLKLNPQHTLPTMVDGDLSMGESRAICAYLVNKYAPGHALYPTCSRKRALIDRFLYFDVGTLYLAFAEFFYPKLFYGKEPEPEKAQKVKDALGFLQEYLGDKDFLTGGEPSLADLSIGCSLTVLECTGYGFPGYPKVEAYYKRITKLPHWHEVNDKGITGFKQFVESKK